nr:hypothetical protein [Enterococcus sp. 7F3_DIV0205]
MKIKAISLVVIVVILGIGGKLYMDEQEKIREERNMAIKNVQVEASKYIIENYVGIKKIEWHGWSVSKGPLSILTSMTVNDYPMGEDGDGLFSYSAGGEKYIKKYTDIRFEVSPEWENDMSQEEMAKTLRKAGIRKSKEGSSNTEIIYNWEERK